MLLALLMMNGFLSYCTVVTVHEAVEANFPTLALGLPGSGSLQVS